jgi:hypothetical protein
MLPAETFVMGKLLLTLYLAKARCNAKGIRKNYKLFIYGEGARGGVVVKALRYKPAGRGFDSRWCHWNFSMT